MATGTPNLREAVDKALGRAAALGEDLQGLRERVRDALPEALASERQKRDRRQFLELLYDEEREGRDAFERIIGGNELQDANFLARGALVAKTIMRIVIRSGGGRILGYGTGSLIGDGVLLTNHHVLQNRDVARASYAEAFYERGIEGDEARTLAFALDPDKLWVTSSHLDFTIVGVAEADRGATTRLSTLGWLPLIGRTGKVVEGEWMTIVQHPKGERKQLCVRENQLLKCDNDVLWYSTDTLGGSSGSPVFNNDWLMVALHHSSVPEVKDGRWQTIDGRDYDPVRDDESRVKWIANEGIRVSRILETLRSDNEAANKPPIAALLKLVVSDVQVRLPVLYASEGHRTNAIASIAPNASGSVGPAVPNTPSREANMTKRRVTVTLEIDEDGSVSIPRDGSVEASLLENSRPARAKVVIEAPVDPMNDWKTGYDPRFLGTGDLIVNLPEIVATDEIAPLKNAYGQTFTPQQKAEGVLNYWNYSVVMNKERRFAFYSAANVNGGMRTDISGRVDDWLFDDRIDRKYQVDNSFYKKARDKKRNDFDRGHLTRREDLEWGDDPKSAVRKANGTCTWTNCSPQHAIFNQDKHPDNSIHLWQGLERYILEETAKHDQFKVQVITGPIFGAADPVFRDIAYPLEFWKVVVAVGADGKLFATGYVLGQKDVIDQFGIEEAAEVPFGAYGTYQRPLSVIENVTGLRFTYGAGRKSLRDVDPLARPQAVPRRRRRRAASEESFDFEDASLQDFDEIIL